MPAACSFRQVDEKHVAAEVEVLLWSPKMDLIASSNVNGEVILYRLSWQKVWTMAAAAEGVKVKAMAWRPDGKVLAVGYDSGEVRVCYVENASVLHTLNLLSVSCLSWISRVQCNPESDTAPIKDVFEEQAAQFLPKLPNFPKSFGTLAKGQSEEDVEDAKKLKGQNELNVLLVATNQGDLLLYSYGVSLTSVFNLQSLGLDGEVTNVLAGQLSLDLKILSLLIETHNTEGSEGKLHYVSFDTTLIATRHRELRILALKFGQLLTLLQYVDTTIQQMQEASEDILLEMESKLMKLATEKDMEDSESGPISNDFLKLLLFGNPSFELQSFLQNDLTERGLKKLGHSIENSYSNIQKLVLKHLQSVAQAFVYHLSDLRGMSAWYDKFGILGLSTEAVDAALKSAGSFMLKAIEIQQVIDSGMKNFKAFFRWLYVVILRLSDEPIPAELSKMTQQDCNFVAQFLKENFTEDVSRSNTGFKLEKVGQYLKAEDLSDPPDTSGNPWTHFLEGNHAMKGNSVLYPAEPTKSLVQMQQALTSRISVVLEKAADVIGQSLQLLGNSVLSTYTVREDKEVHIKATQFSSDTNEQEMRTLFAERTGKCHKCYLLRQKTNSNGLVEGVALVFGSLSLDESSTKQGKNTGDHPHQILDVAFYDNDTLSVLLLPEDREASPLLAQVPLAAIEQHLYTAIDSSLHHMDYLSVKDLGPEIDGMNCRKLENMKACGFAVSGTRKVACVLFTSRRRVRLFMMDAEDEDEEEEPSTCTSRDTTRELDTSNLSGISSHSHLQDEDEDKENTSHSSTAMDM